jgi:hypothetical protein
MTREEAFKLVQEKIQNKNLFKHALAVEACMKALALHFNEDEEKWALAGLLHDIDYEETKDDPKAHSISGAEMLDKLGLDQEIVQAVRTHNEIHGLRPETKMAKSLFCVDPLTGLIVAATLVMPSKKIADLTVENVLNRFKEKSFARGADREIIMRCEDIDLTLEKFVEICLRAMQEINSKLGL